MNRIIVTILLVELLLPAQCLTAQENNAQPTTQDTLPVLQRYDAAIGFDAPPRHSVGGLIGPLYLGVTWKARPAAHFAVQTDLVVQAPYSFFFPFKGRVWNLEQSDNSPVDIALFGGYLNVNFLYNSHRIGRQFDWFIGGGVRAGYLFGMITLGGFYGGVDLMAGFDWHSRRIPLDVSFDLRPFVGIIGGNTDRPFGMCDIPITVSLRRRF